MYSTTFPGSIVDINYIFLDQKTPEPHRATSMYVYGHNYVSVVLIIEELTFLAIESSTYGITCRLVQQTLIAFASLTSQLVTIIFYCTVN